MEFKALTTRDGYVYALEISGPSMSIEESLPSPAARQEIARRLREVADEIDPPVDEEDD